WAAVVVCAIGVAFYFFSKPSFGKLKGMRADIWLYGGSKSSAQPVDGIVKEIDQYGILILTDKGQLEWHPLDRVHEIRNIHRP
ncbi:MAG: hypothetical protein KDN20_26200, partial [Verrucomicrobiae bacterium]|nr:hypothetical protein [Verrucomicrobiae bacterium]